LTLDAQSTRLQGRAGGHGRVEHLAFFRPGSA
jgi:hypothetical protein